MEQQQSREQRVNLLESQLARLWAEQNVALQVNAIDDYFRLGREIRDLKQLIAQESEK